MTRRAREALLGAEARLAERLPPRLVEPVAQAHRPIARYLAATPYRRKYGGPFLAAIHPEDDLLHHALPDAAGRPAFRYYHATKMYFSGGEWNAHEIESILEDVGHPLSGARSLLEFACGYGRLTRHFVQTIDASRITVSDIDHGGVDFLRRRLGVGGFYSAASPGAVDHDRRHDVIVVVSLFSHLPSHAWAPWLRRLEQFLAPGGVLVLTTHNYADADPRDFETQADGFLYAERNETRGRLDGAEYGAAFVTEGYVRRLVADAFDGRLIKFFPHALLIAQDAYTLQRA